MSFDAVKEELWQSIAKCTIRERCKTIFNQELLSDVKFVVPTSQGGSERKKIPAHKLVLAISSPVFFVMFYGELAETKDSVEISDCEYESMLELLRFIYSDEVNLNPDNVMQVLYLAKKYMLPSLAEKCSAFLQENLDASNVFHILPDAQKYEETDLLDHCWKVVERETTEAVKSDGFGTIERSVLEELVEKASLNVKEVELFKAVDRWAVKECGKQGLEAEGPAKRSILGERIVKGIRFPVMEQKEFAEVVLDSDILTNKEAYGLMKYFNSVLKTPVGFSDRKRAGFTTTISRFKSHKKGQNLSRNVSDVIDIIHVIDVKASKDIKLHAVRLFGCENGQYSVTLKIWRTIGGAVIATEKGTFLSKPVLSKVGQYEGFEVGFVTPVTLKADHHYLFEAEMSGPLSWNGENGQSCVEHLGVTFTFRKSPGARLDYISYSSVSQGQFSEFLYSLD